MAADAIASGEPQQTLLPSPGLFNTGELWGVCSFSAVPTTRGRYHIVHEPHAAPQMVGELRPAGEQR